MSQTFGFSTATVSRHLQSNRKKKSSTNGSLISSMSIINLGDLKSAQWSVRVKPMIPFLTELSLVTKGGSFMIVVNNLVNGLIVMSSPKLHQKNIMVTVWWSKIGVITYSFLETNQSIIG